MSTTTADRKLKCAECDCDTHWAFRRTAITATWLCDTCWGYRYGGQTCVQCQRNCYDEDVKDNAHICDHCAKEAV